MHPIRFPSDTDLSLDWLRTAVRDEDPFRIVTNEPYGDTTREVCLGNGLLAVALGAEGTGGYEHNLAPTRIAGLWAHDRLLLPPDFSIFRYHDGKHAFSRQSGEVHDYEQVLDLGKARCLTRWDWSGKPGRRSRIEISVTVCRHDPGLLLQEMKITPDFEGEVSVEDGVDARRCEAVDRWQSRRWSGGQLTEKLDSGTDHQRGGGGELGDAGEILAFGAPLGIERRTYWMAARLDVEGCDATSEWLRQPAGLFRKTRFHAQPGQAVTLRRFVYVGGEDPDLLDAEAIPDHLSGLHWEQEQATHEAAMTQLWERTQQAGPVRLRCLLNVARHHLFTSARAGRATGLAPLGLCGRRWRGGTLWDADTWIFPALLAIDPDLSRTVPDFRFGNLDAARALARESGLEGAAFPWISTVDGRDVCYLDAFRAERHVSNSVVLAAWKQAEADRDPHWRREVLWPLVREVAAQWVSRAVPDPDGERYHLLNICGPDEAAERVDDNAYTLLTSARVIRWAIELGQESGEPVPAQWEKIAHGFQPHWDEENDIPLEHRDYKGETIKQADTALLVYPWRLIDDPALASRISAYYRTKYPEHPIMMTHPIDGIVDALTGDKDGPWKAFGNMLESFHPPFFTMTESAVPMLYPFLTGYGALLQMMSLLPHEQK
jgi:trehalose/maltose hydrolase-like predicted phosphorylase